MVYIAKPIAIVIYTALAIFLIWSKLSIKKGFTLEAAEATACCFGHKCYMLKGHKITRIFLKILMFSSVR